MTEISTTEVDNPVSDAPVPGAGVIDETPTSTEETQTPTGENLDESEKSTDASADQDNKPDETKDDTETDTPASKFDDDLDQWIEKRGTPKPTTDEERQALQDIRNEQREFTRAQQAKKEADNLKDVIDDAKPKIDQDEDEEEDPLEKKVRLLEEQNQLQETTRLQSEFLTTGNDGKPVTEEQFKVIQDIMKEKFARPTTEAGKLTAFYQWSSPDALPDLLELAKARIGSTVDTEAEKEAARQEERDEIARASQANSASRASKSTVTTDESEDDARLKRFSDW